MKYLKTQTVLVFVLALTINIFAGVPHQKNQKAHKLIEKNLLMGLNSENRGLRISSAYYLGELGFSTSVIPLMKLFHNTDTEEERIMAAVSLYKLGDARGLWAIQRSIIFDDSERVRRTLTNFHMHYLNSTK